MTDSNLINCCGQDFVIPQLTVSRIRGILDEVIRRGESPDDSLPDLVGGELFAEVSLHELTLITGITAEQMESSTPDDLRPLVAKIKELNPDYIAMRSRLAALGDAVQRLPLG